MTREEAIDVIKNEAECVRRQGKTGECCRDEMGCGACDLVMEDVYILEAYLMACKALEEPKQGEWINDNASWGFVDLECPFCHSEYLDIDHIDKWNFCPNCGAKMKEGDEK